MGTPRYMSPEILAGTIGNELISLLRSDVYSLGLVLWEILSRAKHLGQFFFSPLSSPSVTVVGHCRSDGPVGVAVRRAAAWPGSGRQSDDRADAGDRLGRASVSSSVDQRGVEEGDGRERQAPSHHRAVLGRHARGKDQRLARRPPTATSRRVSRLTDTRCSTSSRLVFVSFCQIFFFFFFFFSLRSIVNVSSRPKGQQTNSSLVSLLFSCRFQRISLTRRRRRRPCPSQRVNPPQQRPKTSTRRTKST